MRVIRQPVLTYIFNRYHHASPSRVAVIELRIAFEGRQKYMSTGIRVYPNEWKRSRVVNRMDAVILNKTLDKLMNDVRQVIYEMYDEGHIDIFAIPARITAKQRVDVAFLDFCEKQAKIRKYGKAADSQERYDRFLTFLKDWGKIKTFYDLTEHKVMELDRYLLARNMKAKSRWNNYHRFLNSFILDARKDGLIQVNPYDKVKIDRGNDYDGIDKFLYPEEFHKLRNAAMPNERLERIRDLFVFQTYTCLAYHDLAKFSTADIKEVELTEVLSGRRGKTNVEYMVPLLAPAREILQKYGGLPASLTVKKKVKGSILTNQKYNTYIKEVLGAAGIDRPATTHWARHTGATLLLNAGVPLPVVSKVCGHSSIKMTERIYAKLLDHTVVKEVMAVEQKLI